MEGESFLKKCLKIGLAASFYWFSSITMVFMNKLLLKSKELDLDAPIFVTFIQCFVAVIICHIVSLFAGCKEKNDSRSIRFDHKTSREVMPLSICFLAMIVFSNLCLRELGVAFYSVGRSLSILFYVVFSYLLLKKSSSLPALVCCLAIITGYMIGVYAEGALVDLSYFGVGYGLLSSFFVSLNSIYTTKTLPAVDKSPWKLGYYNNLNSCILLLPVVILSGDISTLWHYPNISSPYLWLAFLVVSVFGFMTGFATSWQIKMTTPLTHSISATAKAYTQTVLAVSYFQAPKTAIWWFSSLLVLTGSFFYAVVQQRIMKKNHDEQVKSEADAKS